MNKIWMFALVLSACSDPPAHKGKVTDRWGKPIAGVTVGLPALSYGACQVGRIFK